MCAAYHERMTQKEGYVWFLPGWFNDKWYDIDELKLHKQKLEESKQKMKEDNQTMFDSFKVSNPGTIPMFGDSEVTGELPDCTTDQMLEALDGHLSLVHSNFAPDDQVVRNNKTVLQWKRDLHEKLVETKHEYDLIRHNQDTADNHTDHTCNETLFSFNKYSGYVYDAVWLYALALETLVTNSSTQSFIQNLHSEQSVEEFVKIISATDFNGVSGRINFRGRPSRLSEVKILQSSGIYCNNYNINFLRFNDFKINFSVSRNQLHEVQVGLYTPDYGDDTVDDETREEKVDHHGRMTQWNASLIRWKTQDGSKPLDNPKECGILSGLATKFDIECQLAITIVFIISFIILLLIIFIMFIALKIRYEQKMKATEERMKQLGLLTPTSVLTLDEWEIPRDRVVINRKLEEGAFGTVCGGEAFFDEKGWVAVAVKTLKVGSTLEEKIDFLSEADMMKRFDHRNIVKLQGVCTRNEPVYAVMEYMLYGDLKT